MKTHLTVYVEGVFDLRGAKLFKGGKCPLFPPLKKPYKDWMYSNARSWKAILAYCYIFLPVLEEAYHKGNISSVESFTLVFLVKSVRRYILPIKIHSLGLLLLLQELQVLIKTFLQWIMYCGYLYTQSFKFILQHMFCKHCSPCIITTRSGLRLYGTCFIYLNDD